MGKACGVFSMQFSDMQEWTFTIDRQTDSPATLHDVIIVRNIKKVSI